MRPPVLRIVEQIDALGLELAAELAKEYPAGTRIHMRLRVGVPPSEVEVLGVDRDQPGRLRIKYASGFESSVHCRYIVEAE